MLLTPKNSLTGRPASLTSAQSENQIKQYILEKQLFNQKTALEFLEEFLKIQISSDKPHLALQDGITLCTLLNTIRPGTIKQISKATTPFSKMSNIYNFLNGASKLGLEDADLFETVDLYDGKDMARVYLTILAIARKFCQAPYPQRTYSSRDKNRNCHSSSITDNKVFPNKLPSTPISSNLKSEKTSIDNCISVNVSPLVPHFKLTNNTLQNENNLSKLSEKKDSGYSINPFIKDPHLASRSSPLSQSFNTPSRAPSRKTVSQLPGLDSRPTASSFTKNVPIIQSSSIVSSTDTGVSEKIKNLKLFFDSGASQSHLPKQSNPLNLRNSKLDNNQHGKNDIPLIGSFSSKPEPISSIIPQVIINSEALDFDEFSEPDSQVKSPSEVFGETVFKMDSVSSNDNSPVSTTEDGFQKPLNFRVMPGGIIEDLDLTIKKSDSIESRRGDVLRLNTIDWELDNESSDEDLTVDSTNNNKLLSISTKSSVKVDCEQTLLNNKAILGNSFSSDSQSIKIVTANIHKTHSRNYSEKPNISLQRNLTVARPRSGSAGQDEISKDRVSLFFENSKLIAQYQLGDCIGKGQFGSVYKALNLQTGQIVAIKRIELEGRSNVEVDSLMGEVDLLKSLSHVRIVKYEGYVQSNSYLNIILEYVENGSLQQLLRSYGAFSETLVASYSYQILEGLMYLHEKQVVHCDLKAANILTTKKGKVKLTDFGVSLNLEVKDSDIGEIAAGTPYWMAPEVITLQGASTASDIWSMGCTIIELLTGKPPYHDLNKHAALYRIVEDDRPPMPDFFSETLKSFLSLCFKKNPLKRPTAQELSCHDWLIESHLNSGIGNKLNSNGAEQELNNSHESQITESLWESLHNIEDNQTPSLTTSKPRLSEKQPLVVPDHNFIKSVFEKPIICKLCNTLVKEQAMLCLDCKIICHTWCIGLVKMSCQVGNDELISPHPQSSRKWLDKKLGLAFQTSEMTNLERRPFYSNSNGSINNSKKDLNVSSTPSSSSVPWSSQKKVTNRKKKHNGDCCIS